MLGYPGSQHKLLYYIYYTYVLNTREREKERETDRPWPCPYVKILRPSCASARSTH